MPFIGRFVLDFCCPASKLAVEIDGSVHDGQVERDSERTTWLEAAGYPRVEETRLTYLRRRDALVDALRAAGWPVSPPAGTMFVWAPIPEPFRALGSVEFARLLLREAGVVVSPGVGFGEEGEGYVRFALIEAEDRLREAAARVGKLLAR